MPSESSPVRPSAASVRYARQLASLVPKGGRGIQASAAAVPASYLGATFVWDETTHGYVQSDLAGAPSTGVRFLLYAVDPVTATSTSSIRAPARRRASG